MKKRNVIAAAFALGLGVATVFNVFDTRDEFNYLNEKFTVEDGVRAEDGEENTRSWCDFLPLAHSAANTVATGISTVVVGNYAFPDDPKTPKLKPKPIDEDLEIDDDY